VAREQGLNQERLRRWASFLALWGVLEQAAEQGVIGSYYVSKEESRRSRRRSGRPPAPIRNATESRFGLGRWNPSIDAALLVPTALAGQSRKGLANEDSRKILWIRSTNGQSGTDRITSWLPIIRPEIEEDRWNSSMSAKPVSQIEIQPHPNKSR
jgi:hypothetical protein